MRFDLPSLCQGSAGQLGTNPEPPPNTPAAGARFSRIIPSKAREVSAASHAPRAMPELRQPKTGRVLQTNVQHQSDYREKKYLFLPRSEDFSRVAVPESNFPECFLLEAQELAWAGRQTSICVCAVKGSRYEGEAGAAGNLEIMGDAQPQG